MTDSTTSDVIMEEVVEKRLRIILEEGDKIPMSFEYMKPELPSFYDEKKFRFGQQAFYNNIFSMMIAKLCGLVSLLAIKTILDVIMFTQNSSTACIAYRRYASTILHTLVWHEKDPTKSKEFLESLTIVRKKHCTAFKKSTAAGLQRATQLDMALAQFGFMGYIMVSKDTLGISTTDEEMEGIVHLWRIIGYMLGIEDRFNLCSGTVEETRALCQKILEDVFLPSLAKKNEHFDSMRRTLLEALWPVNMNIDVDAFTAYTLYLASTSASNNNHFIKIDTANMSFYSWYTFNLQYYVLKYLMSPTSWWSPFFRAIFNGLMRLSLYCMEHFPFIASWIFTKKYAEVNIFRFD